MQNTEKKPFFLKSVFAGFGKSRLQDCSVREKGSILQNSTGAWGKKVPKKTTGSRGVRNFS